MKTKFCIVVSMIALLAGCGGEQQSQNQGDGNGKPEFKPVQVIKVDPPSAYPYKVTCTVGMVADVVRAVAGDKAEVQHLVGEGVDPHVYRATRDDMVKLSSADVIFYNGLHLEGQLGETLEKVGKKRPVYAATRLIASDKLLYPEGGKGYADPHVWMDPRLWGDVAVAVGAALGEYDPANRDYYAANAKAFQAKCLALHEYAKKVIATVPESQRLLVTSHDAFSYLGRAYGIEVRGVQGISTESEAGLADINALVDVLVTRKVSAIFVESSVAQKNIQALKEGAANRGHTVKIGGELFSDAMGKPGTYRGTYLGMIDHNVTTLVRALGGEAPEGGFQGKLTAE